MNPKILYSAYHIWKMGENLTLEPLMYGSDEYVHLSYIISYLMEPKMGMQLSHPIYKYFNF